MRRLLLLVGLVGCDSKPQRYVNVFIEPPDPAGVEVFLQDADGEIVDRQTTNGQGFASGPTTVGGSLIVIDPFGHDDAAGTQLYQIVDNGDLEFIELHRPSRWRVGSYTGDASVSFPPAPSPGGAYQVSASNCSVSGHVSTLSDDLVSLAIEQESCPDPTDLLVFTQDSALLDPQPREYQYVPDLEVGVGFGTNGPWTPFEMQSVTFTNVPALADGSVTAETATSSPRGPLFSHQTTLAAGESQFQFAMPAFTDALTTSVVSLRRGLTTHHVAAFSPYNDAVTFEVGSRLLADATACAVYSRTAGKVAWSENDAGVRADFVAATIDVTPNDGREPWTWHVVGEGDIGTLDVAALSRGLDRFTIASSDRYVLRRIVRGAYSGGYEWVIRGGTLPSILHVDGALGPTATATTEGCEPL